MKIRLTLAALLLCSVAACATREGSQPAATVAATSAAEAGRQAQTDRLNAFVDAQFDRNLERHPELATEIGDKRWRDRWGQISEATDRADYDDAKQTLATLASFDDASLTEPGRLTKRVIGFGAEQTVNLYPYRLLPYIASHQSGPHISAPSMLMAQQELDSLEAAGAYLSRLRGMLPLLQQASDEMELRARAGILPPHFMFRRMRDTVRELTTGAPFQNTQKESPLLADFHTKLNQLQAPLADKKRLLAEARTALQKQVAPGYRRFLATVDRLEPLAKTDLGVGALPNGVAFYRAMLVDQTSLADADPEQIHRLGLTEVARIRGEMQQILRSIGEKEDLQAYFHKLRTDPRFYFPNNDAGRAAYLKEANGFLDGMKARLPELFGTLPKAAVEIRRIEPFREKNAPDAHYLLPAEDGSRPGIFYVNMRDMKDRPRYDTESMVYHEAVPGHHLQLAIAQEATDLPRSRRYYNANAYAEGWALYTEKLAKEIGRYADPVSDFGRLGAEIWRAARLVVDTGIHAKGWSHAQAVKYFVDNVPVTEATARGEIDRYFASPAQATSYKVGMLEILRLRERAKTALGAKFDLRGFHDLVVRNGAVPLAVLGSEVDRWIAARKA